MLLGVVVQHGDHVAWQVLRVNLLLRAPVDNLSAVVREDVSATCREFETFGYGFDAERRSARSQYDVCAVLLRCEQRLACSRRNLLLVVGECAIEVECDGAVHYLVVC